MLPSHVHTAFCRKTWFNPFFCRFCSLQYILKFMVSTHHLSASCVNLVYEPHQMFFFFYSFLCWFFLLFWSLTAESWIAGLFCSIDWTIKPGLIFGCPVANTYSFNFAITQNTSWHSLYICFCFFSFVSVSFELLWRNVEIEGKKGKYLYIYLTKHLKLKTDLKWKNLL